MSSQGRAKPMVGRGSDAPAVGLARWYLDLTGQTGGVDQRLVALVKHLIGRVGDGDRARKILKYHASDRWRYDNQKDLKFVLSNLNVYLAQLGLDIITGPISMSAQERANRPTLPAHYVFGGEGND